MCVITVSYPGMLYGMLYAVCTSTVGSLVKFIIICNNVHNEFFQM